MQSDQIGKLGSPKHPLPRPPTKWDVIWSAIGDWGTTLRLVVVLVAMALCTWTGWLLFYVCR